MREIFVVYDVAGLSREFLAGKTAVVFDVLRATSSMVAALQAGAVRIVPTLEIAEARAMRQTLPAGAAVLGGERDGLPITGFDLGNSPQEFSPAAVGGKTVIMTTTNGTRAILAARGAARLYIAALTNVAATARAVAERSRSDVVLVGSGTQGFISWEDSFAAGAAVERLLAIGPADGWHLADSAMIALAAWQSARRDLPSALRRGRGGQNIIRAGLESAFAACGAIDTIELAAIVHQEPLEIVIDRQDI